MTRAWRGTVAVLALLPPLIGAVPTHAVAPDVLPPAPAIGAAPAAADSRVPQPRAALVKPTLTAAGEAGSVTFTWTRGAPSNAKSVTWEFDPIEPDGPIERVTSRSYEVEGDPGDVIKARVRALSGRQVGPWSQAKKGVVQVPAPGSFAARATSSTQIQASWKVVPGADDYEIAVDGVVVREVDGTKSSVTISGLQPGTEYAVKARTVLDGERSSWSKTVTVETTGNSPGAPTDLRTVSLTPTEATVAWTATASADSYEVFVDSVRTAVVYAPTTSVVLRGLTPGSTYSVRVTATIDGVTSPPSVPVGFTTPASAPTGLQVSSVTQSSASLAWSPMSGAVGYDVFLDGALVGSAVTTNFYAFTSLVAGQTYQAAVRARYPSGIVSGTSSASFTTSGAVAPTSLNVISITATSATLTWLPVTGATAYDVFINGTLVGSAVTSNAYVFTSLSGGQTYTAAVRSRFSSGAVSSLSTRSFTTSTDPAQAPVNAAAPTVTLSSYIAPVPGSRLTATTGTWTSQTSITYAYQWQRSGDNSVFGDVPGATSSTYTVQSVDVGTYFRVRVTATNANGSTASASSSVAPVAIVAPSEVPQVQGFAVVGETLTFMDAQWSSVPPPTLSLTWQSLIGNTWTSIPGRTGPSLTLDDTQFGRSVRVMVTATVRDGSVTYYSEPRGPVSSSLNTVPPVVTGALSVGQVLTTSGGTWRPAGTTLTYGWQRYDAGAGEWDVIAGQTGSTYTLRADDAGALIRSVVGSINNSVTSPVPVYAYSAAYGPVAGLINVSPPVITGVPNTTTVLSATSGVWSPSSGVAFAYQWQRSQNGITWVNISGATSSTYTPASDAGYSIRVQVTASIGLLSSAVTSASTTLVNAPYNSSAPTVSGVARAGAPLTGAVGTWATGANAPTDDTIQWQSSPNGILWTNVAGATTLSYTPDVAVASQYLRIAVTRSNASGATTAYSSPTGQVLPPLNTLAPTIGSPSIAPDVDDSVWVTYNGAWSNQQVTTVTSFAYQWQRSADGGATWTDIPGATLSEYELEPDDVNRLVRCRVQVAGYTSGVSFAVSSALGPIGP